MPELPEVETTARGLKKEIVGAKILSAWMDPEKSINVGRNQSWATIKKHVTGNKITDVTRRAKYVVIKLEDDASLWIHQKMTGHFMVGKWRLSKGKWQSQLQGPMANDPMNQYIRLLFDLNNGCQLALSDARRFARIIYSPKGQPEELSHLGPEPLELSAAKFRDVIHKSRGMIKAALVNPEVVVGIGNIYADEILHLAGVHPFMPIAKIAPKKIDEIYRVTKRMLLDSIKVGGSSTDDYRTPDGSRGGYQKFHRVYQKAGQSCSICHKGKIERVIKNGRSSHFCPKHQIL